MDQGQSSDDQQKVTTLCNPRAATEYSHAQMNPPAQDRGVFWQGEGDDKLEKSVVMSVIRYMTSCQCPEDLRATLPYDMPEPRNTMLMLWGMSEEGTERSQLHFDNLKAFTITLELDDEQAPGEVVCP